MDKVEHPHSKIGRADKTKHYIKKVIEQKTQRRGTAYLSSHVQYQFNKNKCIQYQHHPHFCIFSKPVRTGHQELQTNHFQNSAGSDNHTWLSQHVKVNFYYIYFKFIAFNKW
jgi:hypothetical protein